MKGIGLDVGSRGVVVCDLNPGVGDVMRAILESGSAAFYFALCNDDKSCEWMKTRNTSCSMAQPAL